MEGEIELWVRRASIEVVRTFEVAREIDLNAVESLLARQGAVARVRLSRTQPKALAFDDPPVVSELIAPALELGGSRADVRASARIHAFGVISLSLIIVPPRAMTWAEFERFSRDAERATTALDFWQAALDQILDPLRSVVRLSGVSVEEDYNIVTIRELDPPIRADQLLDLVDLVPLLTHDRRPLSERARRDVFRHVHSYYRDDLVVLTWERAFVLEPSDDNDISDVLEVANAQLLELRFYDSLLDSELPMIHEAARTKRPRVLGRNRYASAASQMRELVAEVTQITETVDNALKVTEDVYLARVYSAALEVFRVRFWAASIQRKLALIREAYTALYDEAMATRAEWLEASIVALIILEIVLFVFFM